MQDKDEKLKIVFFGLGSIGKKHLKILQDNYDFEIYLYKTGKGQEKNDLQIKTFTDINEVFSIKPDIVFITNPTFLHVETALLCAKNNIDLFIEKSLSHNLDKIDELENIIKKNRVFSYVAYNMRFHPVIQNLKKMIDEKPIYFKVICSSYLPNWRLNQDYSKSYSAKKQYGGGVTLDVSHEFDYISWLFNEIKNIEGVCDKVSNLDIETEDIIDVNITCKGGVKGNLHLDYFNSEEVRKIQIYYDDKYIEGDLINNTIITVDKNNEKHIEKFDSGKDETYTSQIKYFIDNYIDKNYNLMNNLDESVKTFKKIIMFKEKNCKI